MDFDKLKQWMELAKKYQSGEFWNGMFDQSSFNEFMKENMDMGQAQSSGEMKQSPPKDLYPKIDIYLTDFEVTLLADLAGYKKEDLQVSVSGSKLLLKGTSTHISRGQPFLQERIQGSFERIIDLPEPADSKGINAKFENGLLILTYKRKDIREERVTIE